MTVKVGVMLPTFEDRPETALEAGAEAERLGLDGVFVYDHLWPMGSPERPALAPFALLGALAVRTSAIFLGPLVARVGVVPEETLVAQFAALDHLAPNRVIASLGTGDHLSFNENRAYGLPLEPAQMRRAAAGRCASALLELGLPVWIGGAARQTRAVAEATGAAVNLWQASAEEVAEQALRTEVTWAGMVRSGASGEEADASELVAIGQPLVTAGASWVVFGWPVRLDRLAAAAGSLRG